MLVAAFGNLAASTLVAIFSNQFAAYMLVTAFGNLAASALVACLLYTSDAADE